MTRIVSMTVVLFVTLAVARGDEYYKQYAADEYYKQEPKSPCYHGVYPRISGNWQGPCVELTFNSDFEEQKGKGHYGFNKEPRFDLHEEEEYLVFSGQDAKKNPYNDFFTAAQISLDGSKPEYTVCMWLRPKDTIAHEFICVEEDTDGGAGRRHYTAEVDDKTCEVVKMYFAEEDFAGTPDVEKCELFKVKKFTEVADSDNLYPELKNQNQGYSGKTHEYYQPKKQPVLEPKKHHKGYYEPEPVEKNHKDSYYYPKTHYKAPEPEPEPEKHYQDYYETSTKKHYQPEPEPKHRSEYAY